MIEYSLCVIMAETMIWRRVIRRDCVPGYHGERLLARRNRSPKEGEPDSPPWVIHEQGRSANSNKGIPPHNAVLDLGTTRDSVGTGTRKPGPLAS